MINVNTIIDDIPIEDRLQTKEIVERLKESSLKFLRQWIETPAPLWLSTAIEDHKARIATYDYILTVLDVGTSYKGPFLFDSVCSGLPDHYEGTQYVENCSIDVVLAFAKAYLLSGHDVEIISVPNGPTAAQGTASYRLVYKK